MHSCKIERFPARDARRKKWTLPIGGIFV